MATLGGSKNKSRIFALHFYKRQTSPIVKNTTESSPANTSLRITDEAEACAAVLLACLRSSDIYGMVENAAFHHTIKNRNVFQGRDAAALVAAAEQYFEQAGSPQALIDAAFGAIREQTRMPLFYQCLDVMLSDGIVTPQEHKIFLYMKSKFRVDNDVAWGALEVLVTKNKL